MTDETKGAGAGEQPSEAPVAFAWFYPNGKPYTLTFAGEDAKRVQGGGIKFYSEPLYRAALESASAVEGREPSDTDAFKRARLLHLDFAINRYLMSNADGRESGAEKALRHREICEFYVNAYRGQDDDDENWFWAVHSATQELTDNLDTKIGFPIRGAPDYDKLAPLFFERFDSLARAALSPAPAERGGAK